MGFERSRRVFLAGAAAPAAMLAAPAGAMDPRYSDADGDLTADPSADAKDWLDPDVLIFAYTPVEDPAVYVILATVVLSEWVSARVRAALT